LGCRPAARAGSIGDDAFQLLPALSQLTALGVWGGPVTWGLQHLSGLSRLRELRLDSCDSIRDEHIQALSALTALTALDASWLDITGATLSALASLRTLSVYTCPNISAAGLASIAQLQQLQHLTMDVNFQGSFATELAQLSQLTNLEELCVPGAWIDGPALALLDLPRLTSLEAWRITAEQHEAGRGAGIRSLELYSTQDMPLVKLLPLPSLERLTIHRAYGDLSAVGKQPQLTYLGLGGLERSGGSGLAGVLPELQRLQVLQLGRVRSCLTLEDMLALAQLPQLEELCIKNSDAPGELCCLLQRCSRLRKVLLQYCGSVGLPAMMALVSKPGMREVHLCLVEGAKEHEERLQRVARRLGVQLTVTDCLKMLLFDEDDDLTSEEGDEPEDGLDDEEEEAHEGDLEGE
jgi:hypothetical protein